MEERQIVERSIGKYDELIQPRTCTAISGSGRAARQDGGVDIDANKKSMDGFRPARRPPKRQAIKDQNLVSSYFINHTYFWGDRHLEIYMGPGRGKQQNPQGWAAAYGHHFTSHNDCPVTRFPACAVFSPP